MTQKNPTTAKTTTKTSALDVYRAMKTKELKGVMEGPVAVIYKGESRIVQVDREKMTWKDLHFLAAKVFQLTVADTHFSWKTGVCTDLPCQNDSLKKARVYVGNEFELIPYRK